jgi:VanZ family protein
VNALPIHRRGWAAGAAAWYLLILALTLPPVPVQDLPKIPHLDKLVHAVMFGVQGGLIALTLRRAPQAWMLTTALGALNEYLQRFCPGRSAEWADVAANALGAGAAVALVGRWRRRHLALRSPPPVC